MLQVNNYGFQRNVDFLLNYDDIISDCQFKTFILYNINKNLENH